MFIKAEDLLAMKIDSKLWELQYEKEVTIGFCDGEITGSGGMAIISRYIWTILERYPTLPITTRYYPGNYGYLTTMTHAKIAAMIVLEDARDMHINESLPWDEQEEDYQVYVMTNKISNMIDLHLQRFVVSVDAIDFAEIEKHPKIKELNDKVKAMNINEVSPDVISEIHAEIREVILKCETLDTNPVAMLARQGLVKMPQLLISVGPIGFLTEINDIMFKYPVLNNYFSGFTKLYEPMLESRNATIASMYQEILMRDAEYLSRKMALIGEFVCNLYRGVDCGSKRYVELNIIDYDMLCAMEGMWMKVDGDHTLVSIRPNMRHLIGTRVEVRAPNKCEHPDRSGVCEKCFSELSIQIPDLDLPEEIKATAGLGLQITTNIGHTSVVGFVKDSSQGVLSTKHNKELKSAMKLSLTPTEQEFVRLDETGRELYLAKEINNDELFLVISEKDATNIHDISEETVEKLTASKLTSIVEFKLVSKKTKKSGDIYIGEDKRAGFLSKDMLRHIAKVNYEIHTKHNAVVVDLTTFDKSNPIMIIPQISYSPVEKIADLENFILSVKSKKGKPGLSGYSTVDEAVAEFYDMMAGTNVHMVHLLMVILCVSAQDPENGDFRIPLPRDSGTPVSDNKVLYGRSMGGALAYESHAAIFNDPYSYVNGLRQPHQYDYHVNQVLPDGMI